MKNDIVEIKRARPSGRRLGVMDVARRWRWGAMAAASCAMGLAALGGCQGGIGGPFSRLSDPFTFDTPPAGGVSGGAAALHEAPDRTVVVVGEFEDPETSPLRWRDVGEEMSGELRRALMKDARFDVRLEPSVANDVAKALSRSGDVRERLGKVRRGHPDVDFVVLGRVTDFAHTGEVNGTVARRGWFGAKNEAVSAIEVTIVDLETLRVAAAEHVLGTAGAGEVPMKRRYAGLTMSSYLFWDTPLGKASRAALEKTVDRLRASVPVMVERLRVARVLGEREVELRGGRRHGVEPGQRYFACVEDGGAMRAVNDPATGRPLAVRVTAVTDSRSRGWLVGEAPATVALKDVVLTRDLPHATGVAAEADGER